MAEFCPCCRRNCNCKACLCRQDMIKSNKDAGQPKNEERIQQLKHLIYALSPFLKQFDHEQTVEKEMEAKIKGLSPSAMEIQWAVCCSNPVTNVVIVTIVEPLSLIFIACKGMMKLVTNLSSLLQI